ncbi:hypothetical protein EGX94_12375 [Propionibacterium acidifaciens]|nr:hypothetical protein EGX94_12375 [Propionibacterium acidifaciens]
MGARRRRVRSRRRARPVQHRDPRRRRARADRRPGLRPGHGRFPVPRTRSRRYWAPAGPRTRTPTPATTPSTCPTRPACTPSPTPT